MAEKVNNQSSRYDVSIICAIARMNPPTPGHMSLIRRLIDHAIKLNEDKVFIFLSSRNDPKENPLECTYKQSILGNEEYGESTPTMITSEKQKMIDETPDEELKEKIRRIRVITNCSPSPVDTLLAMLLNKEYEGKRINILIVAGSDRKKGYSKLLESYIKKGKITESSHVNGLEREGTNEYKELNKNTLSRKKMSEIPIQAYSASFVRKVVSYGLDDKFNDIYINYLDPATRRDLYDKIRIGLLDEQESHSSSRNRGSKKRKTTENKGAASSSSNLRRSNRSAAANNKGKGSAGKQSVSKRAKRGASRSKGNNA